MAFEQLEKEIKRSRNFVLIAAFLPALVYLVWFVLFKNQSISGETADWGSFGDFVGGLINPLIGLFALYWLTKSVLIQKTELSETKKALQDTQKSQEEQVKTALKSAKLQTINILLSCINHQIAYERDYVNYVLSETQKHGDRYKVMTRDGVWQEAKAILMESREKLDSLISNQEDLIFKVNNLANEA